MRRSIGEMMAAEDITDQATDLLEFPRPGRYLMPIFIFRR